jgi:predicted site-specific integrase-resolvase
MGRWRRSDLEDGWADLATAARMLGVTVRTLLRWHRQGKGPPRWHNGHGIRYRISEIGDWLRRNPQRRATKSLPHAA